MGLTKPKIVGGVSLPDLTDPAAAADILSGKEAIDEDGEVLTGSHVCKQLHELFPALSNAATAADVASGKQFVDNTGAVVSGTADPNEVTIKITFSSTGSVGSYNYVKVDSTKYTSSKTVKVPKGTTIEVQSAQTNSISFDGNSISASSKTIIADCSYVIDFTTWNSGSSANVIIKSQPNDDILSGTTSSLTIEAAKGKKNIVVFLTLTASLTGTWDSNTLVTAAYINDAKCGFYQKISSMSRSCNPESSIVWDSDTGTLTTTGSLFTNKNGKYYYVAW